MRREQLGREVKVSVVQEKTVLIEYPKTTDAYDCGCRVTVKPSSKMYGMSWKAYLTSHAMILQCRRCGKRHVFELAGNTRTHCAKCRNKLEKEKTGGGLS